MHVLINQMVYRRRKGINTKLVKGGYRPANVRNPRTFPNVDFCTITNPPQPPFLHPLFYFLDFSPSIKGISPQYGIKERGLEKVSNFLNSMEKGVLILENPSTLLGEEGKVEQVQVFKTKTTLNLSKHILSHPIQWIFLSESLCPHQKLAMRLFSYNTRSWGS